MPGRLRGERADKAQFRLPKDISKEKRDNSRGEKHKSQNIFIKKLYGKIMGKKGRPENENTRQAEGRKNTNPNQKETNPKKNTKFRTYL